MDKSREPWPYFLPKLYPAHHGEKFTTMESLHSKLDMQKPDLYGVDPFFPQGFGLANWQTVGSLPLLNCNQHAAMKPSESESSASFAKLKLRSPKLKLEMEMFGDLSGFCAARKPIVDTNMHPTVDELNTPVFELKAPFDYDRHLNIDLQSFTTPNDQFAIKTEPTTLTTNPTTTTVHLEDNAEDTLVFKDDICKLMSEDVYAHNNSLVLSSQRGGNSVDQLMHTQPVYSPISSDCGDLYLSTLAPNYEDEEGELANVAKYSEILLNSNNNSNNSIGSWSNNSTAMPQDCEYFQPYETPDASKCSSETSLNSTLEEKPLLSLERSESMASVDKSFNILNYINNEELRLVEPVLQSLTESPSTFVPPEASAQPQRRKRGKSLLDDDPNDEDYVPPFAKRPIGRRRSHKYIVSDSDDDDEEELPPPKKPARRGRPPKRISSCSSEEYSNCGDSRYREMRDKNNEASRKSRMKRRQKESKLEQEADLLAERNVKLKARVGELEKTVANFRQDLIIVMSKK